MPAKTAAAVDPFADLISAAKVEPKKERGADRLSIPVPQSITDLVENLRKLNRRATIPVDSTDKFDELSQLLRAAADQNPHGISAACRAVYGDVPEGGDEKDAPLTGLSVTVGARRGKPSKSDNAS